MPPEFRVFTLEALQSKDLTIRLRALDIILLTTTTDTVVEIVHQLIQEINNPNSTDIKEDIIATILGIVCKDHYDLIEDFEWLFRILLSLASIKTQKNENQLSGIMLDVVLRVEELRPEACEMLLETL